MTAQLRITDVQQFAAVQEDADWGANGVLDAGDTVYNRNGQGSIVTANDLVSDYALDLFLERATGARIDLVNDSRYPNNLKYIAYRFKDTRYPYATDIRIVKAGYGQILALADVNSYRRPDDYTNSARKSARLSYECWGDPYGACATSLNGEYSQLVASAGAYTRAYDSYKAALSMFPSAYTLSLSNIEGSSGIATKSKAYTDAKAAYEQQYAYFNRATYPWDRPLPPQNPDNDDWDTPAPQPKNPDNDDWDTPAPQPKNPDNDDWD